VKSNQEFDSVQPANHSGSEILQLCHEFPGGAQRAMANRFWIASSYGKPHLTSAFCDVKLSLCDVKCGNDRFIVEDELLIDILDHKAILNYSNSSIFTIPSSFRFLGGFCFQACRSLSSISFESPSGLVWIEFLAFGDCDLPSV
jgi:hypothetical protein